MTGGSKQLQYFIYFLSTNLGKLQLGAQVLMYTCVYSSCTYWWCYKFRLLLLLGLIEISQNDCRLFEVLGLTELQELETLALYTKWESPSIWGEITQRFHPGSPRPIITQFSPPPKCQLIPHDVTRQSNTFHSAQIQSPARKQVGFLCRIEWTRQNWKQRLVAKTLKYTILTSVTVLTLWFRIIDDRSSKL